MPPVGFELTISAGERTQTYVLDRAAIGTGRITLYYSKYVLPSQYRAMFRVVHVLFVAEEMVLEHLCVCPLISSY